MNKFYVLLYHEIIKKEDYNSNGDGGSEINVNQNYQDRLPEQLFTFREEFKKQMDYLNKRGYTTLSLQDIINVYYGEKNIPEKSVLITFDDMYKSVLLYAYPLLKKYNFNAVGFVVSEWLFNNVKSYSSSESVCLAKSELKKMSDVFEYANHSAKLHTRQDGATALQTVDKKIFFEDTRECEKFIDYNDVYAYPFGVYSDKVIQWLNDLNYHLAFTSEIGGNDISTSPFERNAVLLDKSLKEFKEIFI